MSTINTLLDAAKGVTGSDYKTAKALGVTVQIVSDWRHSHKNPQPEDYALVAAVAGLDAEEALIRAVLEKHADKPKGERLLSALGNALRRTTEVATLAFLSSVVLGTTTSNSHAAPRLNPESVATMYIMSNNKLIVGKRSWG